MENPHQSTPKPEKAGQMSTPTEANAPKKERVRIYRRLKPFDKNAPGYNREWHLALCRQGGKTRKPATRALVRLLTRSQKEYATGICKVNYHQAYEFYHLILSFENFRNFTRNELLELLSLMRNDFTSLVKESVIRDDKGKVIRLMKTQRQEAITQKLREFELLLKVGKTFFPELRESFSLNFIKSDVPLNDQNLQLVTPIDAQFSSSTSTSEKGGVSMGAGSAVSTPETAAEINHTTPFVSEKVEGAEQKNSEKKQKIKGDARE